MKVFCWDFDGTLVTVKYSWRDPVIDVIRRYTDLDGEAIEQIKSRMKLDYPWSSESESVSSLSGEDAWGYMTRYFYGVFTDCGIAPCASEAAARAVRPAICDSGRYALYDDTVRTLSGTIRRGAVNVLLTNNYYDLGRIVDSLGIAHLFEDIIISGAVGMCKPDPGIFALARGRRPGAEYYMVGDNVRTDIAGARASGMKTVLVHKGQSEEADYCFDDLYSVLSLI